MQALQRVSDGTRQRGVGIPRSTDPSSPDYLLSGKAKKQAASSYQPHTAERKTRVGAGVGSSQQHPGGAQNALHSLYAAEAQKHQPAGDAVGFGLLLSLLLLDPERPRGQGTSRRLSIKLLCPSVPSPAPLQQGHTSKETPTLPTPPVCTLQSIHYT